MTEATRYEYFEDSPERWETRDVEPMARGLGWFSIGLGLTEILAPRSLSRFIGAPPHPLLLGFLGAREIASGVGILTNSRSAGWVGSRVLGDAMDLALLAGAFSSAYSRRGRLAAATAAVAGVMVLDAWCSRRLRNGSA